MQASGKHYANVMQASCKRQASVSLISFYCGMIDMLTVRIQMRGYYFVCIYILYTQINLF